MWFDFRRFSLLPPPPTPAIVVDNWPHVGGFTNRSLLQLCTVLSLKFSIVSFHFNCFVIPCCFSHTGLKCDYTQTVPPRTLLQVISVGHTTIHQQSNPVCVNWRSIDGLWVVCGPSWPVPRSVGFFWLPGGLPGCHRSDTLNSQLNKPLCIFWPYLFNTILNSV